MDDIDDDDECGSLKPLVVTNLNPTMLKRLGYIIGQSTMLKSLKLSFRNLDITWLSQGLQCNRSIRWFRLRNESRRAGLPGIQFISCLTSFWRNNPSMKSLILDRCFIGSEGLDILTNALLSLRYAGTLRYLDISNNFLVFDEDAIDFSGLVGALTKYKRLRRLLLSDNAIGNKGCTSLAELLDHKNCILKELHLNRNIWMGPESLVILAESLTNNDTLEYLNLNGNHLDHYKFRKEPCWKGWRSVMKLVCDSSSIDNIKESNHILCNVGISSPYHIVNAVINLNAEPNKELVIRQKIIWSHADSRLNIGETIPTGVLPEVIAWFGDNDPRRTNANIIQYQDPPLPYETIRVVRLDSIYRIARSRSDLFTCGATHICSDCRRYAGICG